ncbi:MAG: Enolase [Microgenomates group bacterium GW2011_GWF2_45_18]|nr:MAG: Enolase [Microgenomates group bacterium GW2011_GWF1_44_10]KKU02181.1 MAG: Enolase [Microgenomates group bacterium GW2011_GWF2_45_18]OGJ40912.1 MAG: phosphopyruvate hydratase [Candidatus Pacebacteria bacterium RIFOXYB1_FULL_44_10]HAU99325.1 phosphopyruvate hydratase [Candidatus Paceibacterota bacterium]HAX01843.1 phosphopyruvate hydratase [Candidatus Paceibacterota bacterium]
MATIKRIFAREILDSRAFPTVEATVELDNGMVAKSAVPSGTSTGANEAVELRDHDPLRFAGKGVTRAVKNVNEILAPALIGKDPTTQTAIDQLLVNLDGSPNKAALGANAILSVSQAVSKAGALVHNLPLYQYFFLKYKLVEAVSTPSPIFNLINGGAHGAGNLDIQEFQIVPATHKKFSEALQIGVEIFLALDEVLIGKGAVHSVGIEGGFAPDLYSNADAFQLFLEAIARTNYHIAKDLFLAIDAGSNHYYANGKYKLRDRSEPYSADEMIAYYKTLHEKYSLISVEDGLHESDWDGWKKMTAELQDKMMIIGDDFLTTNKQYVLKAIAEKACTAVLVKPNQIGTVSETVEVVKIAKDAGWQTVFSHRSGETTDDFIADMAVGLGGDFAKFGAPNRGERVAKYNRLWEIEKELEAQK